MVSTTDFPRKGGSLGSPDTTAEQPRKRRFRLFSTLAAPFKDVDDRAQHKKRGDTTARNNSKGNLFTRDTGAPAKGPTRRSPRG